MLNLKKYILVLVSVLLLFSTVSCTTPGNTIIATVDGEKISKEEFVYFLTMIKARIESQKGADLPEDFWETAEIDGKASSEMAKEKALEEVIKAKISKKRSLEAGLKITSQQREEINYALGQLVAKYGEKGADDYLSQFGLNKKLYERVREDSYHKENIMQKLTEDADDETAREFFNTKVVRVKHILIMAVDEQTQQPLEAGQLEQAKIKADEMAVKAKSGADFDKLVAEFSEDPGSKSFPEGYYFGRGFILGEQQGAMDQAFETASFELSIGEISEVVETNYGFHIIKRYANEESEYDANAEELLQRARISLFEDMLEAWKNEAKIEKNEKEYKQIKVTK